MPNSTRKAPSRSVPEPDDELADLTDEQQVALIERTGNELSAADAKRDQPGPDYVPEAG